ncbi:glycosyltransferase family 2 protein [Fimbriiglobus ruber]|uniref:dTDP-Rha:A-D-GlcNAc-diphosphoryl polyprenol, A-3-L-rhamnosyl transferase WbbL n=1 Tax=Fimbriiglobus ruber TaxID=1908690 RepID=A0A225DAJ8_9BACT|nr:glycosyltransferase family 2 protein [Fimbriiglobus ruber]OWK34159.1 dTDP-Rha:A-D-GlcNAc-diphosphoryl polyprenol, A-3-L-rhamnosyl transferase WbbL [Fimbriiglobus ruber]
MNILTVILNYRTPVMTADCLDTLAALPETTAGRMRAVVVDNASGDGSPERLESHVREHGHGTWASVMPRAVNDGFAAGNNAAIRVGLTDLTPPDAVWLLNPDTLVRANALAPLVGCLTANPNVGIVGSRLENRDGGPQRSAFHFPSVLGEFERAARTGPVTRLLARQVVAPPVPSGPTRTEWVSGASMLVRREVFDTVGLLDDGYFLYFEETDFCRRATRAGWDCRYEPASRVVHLVGQSTGLDERTHLPKRVPGYWFAARKRYFESGHGWCYARAADIGWLAGHLLWRTRQRVERRPDDTPPGLVADFIRQTWGSTGVSR